jgi:hypothetical protein
MLVNETFRRCVTFLYEEVPNGSSGENHRKPIGTAFYVSVDLFPDTPGNHWMRYVVTARHVAEVASQLWLRVLGPEGYTDWPVSQDAWYKHSQTDVAIASLEDITMTGSCVRFLHLTEFATREFVKEAEVGEGDDVFFAGLFVGHYGQDVPQPIIRFGNIALMPREPVHVEISRRPKTWASIEAYLTEARSWGGQSGSPAFVTFGSSRHLGSGISFPHDPPYALLGLVQGLWKKDQRGMQAPDPSGEGVVEINMGISIVVPAYKIEELLMREDVVTERGKTADRVRSTRGSLIRPTAASVEGEDEFDRFEDLTRKLVNVPKKEIDEKRQEEC